MNASTLDSFVFLSFFHIGTNQITVSLIKTRGDIKLLPRGETDRPWYFECFLSVGQP